MELIMRVTIWMTILEAGDRVAVVTTDDKSHRFAITGINAGIIAGKTDSVLIDQVAALQKRKFSPGKTIALVGSLAVDTFVGLGIYAATHLSVGF
jgi:hypothetical protein